MNLMESCRVKKCKILCGSGGCIILVEVVQWEKWRSESKQTPLFSIMAHVLVPKYYFEFEFCSFDHHVIVEIEFIYPRYLGLRMLCKWEFDGNFTRVQQTLCTFDFCFTVSRGWLVAHDKQQKGWDNPSFASQYWHRYQDCYITKKDLETRIKAFQGYIKAT